MVNAADCRSASWGFDSLPWLDFLHGNPPSAPPPRDCVGVDHQSPRSEEFRRIRRATAGDKCPGGEAALEPSPGLA